MISASNFLPHRGAAQLALGHASTDSTRRYLESAGMPPERSHCVLIAVVPEDFRPETPWEIPPRILSAEVADVHSTLNQAIAAARHFNRQQLDAGSADRRWALVAYCTAPSKGGPTR